MAYIGKQPVIGNFVKLDAISVVNGQASYTMQNGGANFTEYANVNQFLVSLNGILQSPTDSFTVSSSTITFASNLVTGDVIDFIIVLGNTLDVGVPSDNTVSLAKLTATGTKDATTFLRGDNTFAEAGGGGKVLQVQNMITTVQTSTTSTGYVTTALSDTITPSATSSKILVIATGNLNNQSVNQWTYATLVEDGINLATSVGMTGVYSNGGDIHAPCTMTFLASPNTTSSVTYDVRIKVTGGTGHWNQQNATQSLTLIEIGA